MKFLKLSFLSFLMAVLVSGVSFAAPADEWSVDWIKKVPPIVMQDRFIEFLGQTKTTHPYYFEEVVKLSGHACMVTGSAWTMTKLALEKLYPNGQIPQRGDIQIEAPGAESEWNLGVMGEVMTYITGAAAHGGFDGGAFKINNNYVRRGKLIYAKYPTKVAPKNNEWIFTRLDNGKKVAVKWILLQLKPQPIDQKRLLTTTGKPLATGKASPEVYDAFIKEWDAAAKSSIFDAEKKGWITLRVIK